MSGAADFFVSYTSADRAWAEWIAWQLEAEGYQVVVQGWDFAPGHDWAHEMQQATATAERVVAVLSAAYLGSAHGEAEWRVFYAEDPSGRRGLLLPVRVGLVEPPGLLKTRIYVDLVDQDAAGARKLLLTAARGARGKPIDEPEFPGHGQQSVNAMDAPRFPAELPPTWNVPYHPNPFFAGRDLLLAELHTRLTSSNLPGRRVALTGLGGVGKTQLAVEHAYRRRGDYDLVWWVRGEQLTSLLGDYAALAGQPPLAAQLRLAEAAPQETVVAAVRAWLEHHQRWLLLLDDVDEPQAVVGLLPRSTTGHILVASRTGVSWEQLAIPMPVDVLAPVDATAFLLDRTREVGPEAEEAARTLAATLGGLPLALEQAGAYIAASGTVGLAAYVELFATRALELLKRGQPLGYQHTVATTWSLALQRLQEAEPAAVGLLTLAAFLAPDDLPQPLLAVHSQELPKPLAAAAGDPLTLADAVAALRRYSLIRVIGDGLFVHRLLQTVVRAGLDIDAERAWAAAAVRLLSAGFPSSSDEVTNWAECQRLLPHALAAADHGERFNVEPEGVLSVLNRAAVYLWSRGEYRQALTLFKDVVTRNAEGLGEDHPNTLTSMNNLAATQASLGDLQAARDLHERVLVARRRALGDDHPNTLRSMNNLAETRRDLGDLQGAHDLLDQALADCRRVLGDAHPDTLASMNNLAETRRDLDDLHGAGDLHKQVLAARRRVLGDNHPDTLQSMSNLAAVLHSLGDLQAARELQEQALAGRRRVLGDDHPDTVRSMNDLAEVRRELEEQ